MQSEIPKWCKVGFYIDAKDGFNEWCIAEVKEINKTTVTVTINEWAPKWETSFPIKSPKIAPFRKLSKGYAGTKGRGIKTLDFSKEALISMHQKLKVLLNADLLCEDAFLTTQFYRGKLFMHLDTVLMSKPSPEHFSLIFGFLNDLLGLVIKWLRMSGGLFQFYYQGLGQSELFLEENMVALANIWFELLEMLKRILSVDNKGNELYPHIDQPLESKTYVQTPHKRCKWANMLLENFMESGGFNLFLSVIQIDEEKSRIPFCVLNMLPVYEILELVEMNQHTHLAQKFYHSVLQRVDIISDSELKDLKHEEVVLCLIKLKKFKIFEGSVTIDSVKLNFFLKMLKCAYLEKRIKGLTEINSVVEACETRAMMYDKVNKPNPEDIKQWVTAEKIIEILLNDRPHIELIKRSGVILKFAARNSILAESGLLDLWNSLQSKHESYQRATYDTIIDLCSVLSEAQNDFLFSQISNSEFRHFDSDSFFLLIKEFTIKAIQKVMKGSNEYKTYGLGIFKKLMLDSSPEETRKPAIKYLVKITVETGNIEIKTELLKLVKNLILKNDSTSQALVLFLKIMKNYSRATVEENHFRLIQKILKLAGTVIANLKMYMDRFQIREDFSQNMVQSHTNYINQRLKYLGLVAEKYSEGLSESHFEQLWGMFTNKCPHERSIFFKWLITGHKNKVPVHNSQILFIFTKLFLHDLKFPNKCNSIFEFSCFSHYFIEFNRLQQSIEISEFKMIKNRKTTKLKGLKKLINIYLNTEEEHVLEKSGRLIFAVLSRFDPEILHDAQEIVDKEIKYLLNIIHSNSGDERIVSRILMLLQVLIDKSDEDLELNFTFYIRKAGNREQAQIKINQGKNFRHLRKEVSNYFRIPLERVELSMGDKKFSACEDDFEIVSIRQYWLDLEVMNEQEVYEYIPFEAIKENQEVINLLIELVSRSQKLYTDLAWKLLTFLPTCKSLKNSLTLLKSPLSELIDQSSTYRLLYALKIVLKKSHNQQWVNNFKKANGIDYIITIFLNKNQQDSLKLRASKEFVLLQILTNILEYVSNPSEFVKGIFSSFKIISKATSIGEKLESDNKYFQSLKKLLKMVVKSDSNTLKLYLKENSIKKLIKYSLIDLTSASFVEHSCEVLKKIGKIGNCCEYLFNECYNLLQGAIQEASKTSGYWDLLTFLVAENDISIPASNLAFYLLVNLEKCPSEPNSSYKDEILSGILQVLRVIWKKTNNELPYDYLKLILESCLCEIPESKKDPLFAPPKCKHGDTRENGFKLLLEICNRNPGDLSQVTEYLDRFHLDPTRRTYRKPDWLNSPMTKEKSQTGFVGLKNLGCTCYMNSILQQLFMIKTFRDSILQIPSSPIEESLLYQLQFIFSSLKSSDKQYISPKGFAKSFKDVEGNEINVIEQMDVDEFFGSFMDKLENLLKGSESEEIIKQHFGGVQVTEVIGKECPHRSERYEPFLSISVEVKNRRSLIEGLESYVAEEILEGENAYQCDHCDAKVKAIRRVCVNYLPNYLILALRRFEFDFDTMTREKVNDYFEFASELNMEPFTQEGLDGEKERKCRDYYTYHLRGVVIHTGTAENGHYYSYIYNENKWIEFNDTWVSLVNPQNLPNDCYGGEEKFQYNPYAKAAFRERMGNAYMLIYERNTKFKLKGPEDALEPIELHTKKPENIEDLREVKRQNKKYWRSKIIFGPEYLKFVIELGKLKKTDSKFLAKFFLTVLIRSKEKKGELFEVFARIEDDLMGNREFCNWFCDMLSVESVCKELLFLNPMYAMRKLVVGLGKTAVFNADLRFRVIFFTNLLQELKCARKKYFRHFSQYLELLKYSILALIEIEQKYDYVSILVYYITGKSVLVVEPSPHFFNDIYLGYDQQTVPERAREENFYTDPRGTSICHIINLLYTLRESIPDFHIALLRQPVIITQLLNEADNRLSAISTGKLYTFICHNHRPSTLDFLNKLLDGFKTNETVYKQKISRILSNFLIHEDPLFEEKISEFLENFFMYLKACKIVSEIESNIQFLYKLCCKNAKIADIVNKNPEILGYLEKWVRSNLHILQGVRSDVGYGEESAKNSSSKALQGKLEQIRKKSMNLIWDSDEEICDEKIQVNQKIEFYMTGTWSKGTIIAKAGDIILISYKCQDEECYELKDAKSDEVAPYYTSKHLYNK